MKPLLNLADVQYTLIRLELASRQEHPRRRVSRNWRTMVELYVAQLSLDTGELQGGGYQYPAFSQQARQAQRGQRYLRQAPVGLADVTCIEQWVQGAAQTWRKAVEGQG